MSEHVADIRWHMSGEDFKQGRYTREHSWSFDGGVTLVASSSPAVVPVPLSNPAGVDPEEAFVASISSCHLLTFLWLASKRGFEVKSYEDHAVGTMTKNERRVPWVSKVVLDPRIEFAGTAPTAEELAALHHDAHEHCFIASSVKTEITVKGQSHPQP
jgi:organic hydroperoxide reductase OsmC/OhrA